MIMLKLIVFLDSETVYTRFIRGEKTISVTKNFTRAYRTFKASIMPCERHEKDID